MVIIKSSIACLLFCPINSRSKTVGENLKINPALLSRFDLIFILLGSIKNHFCSTKLLALENSYCSVIYLFDELYCFISDSYCNFA